jgi:type I restriction enzyme M protein
VLRSHPLFGKRVRFHRERQPAAPAPPSDGRHGRGQAEAANPGERVTALFARWKKANAPHLQGIVIGGHPKALIETLSESLLAIFRKAKLVDPYDVYQHLMTYWSETMQDDVYMIVGDGWQAAAQPRQIVPDKDGKTKEKADFTLGKQKYKAELIPPALVIARYFPAEHESLESKAAAIAQKLEELKEEHGGEEGLLVEVVDDKGNVAKKAVTARLKAIKGDSDAEDERALLAEYLDLMEQESAVNKAQKALAAQVAGKYGKLTEAEIKALVVDDKWLARLAADVQSELDRVSQSLTGRVRQLAERYASPLPRLTEQVESLSARVAEHLKKLGAVWN